MKFSIFIKMKKAGKTFLSEKKGVTGARSHPFGPTNAARNVLSCLSQQHAFAAYIWPVLASPAVRPLWHQMSPGVPARNGQCVRCPSEYRQGMANAWGRTAGDAKTGQMYAANAFCCGFCPSFSMRHHFSSNLSICSTPHLSLLYSISTASASASHPPWLSPQASYLPRHWPSAGASPCQQSPSAPLHSADLCLLPVPPARMSWRA